ncbi:MAG: Rieske (2Fe-2S) protein, partial [Pseudomonadota bacterium]
MADIDAAIETAAEGDKALATRRAAAARDLQRRMVRHAGKGSTDMAAAPLRRPASIYTDADRFARETDILFRTLPLVAGLSADMSEPGDRLIFDDAGPPILIVRSKDGKARAFLNMCTHRGSRLVSTCDRAARIACPFHAWTFDLEGWLVGMPGAAGFEDVDRDERALIAVPCEERHGLIFVVPDAGGIMDLDAHLGDFAPVLDLLDLGRAAPVKAG